MNSILGFLLFFAPAAFACDFCMLGQGINPYLTANGRGVTLSEDYIQSDQVYDHGSKIEAHGKKETWMIQSLTGFLAVQPDLTLLITVPYVSKSNVDYDDTSGTNPGTVTNGLGDITLSARYTVFAKHSLETTWLTGILAGVKFPTGRTDLKDNTGEDVDRHAMPGTGSFDEVFGLTSSLASSDGYQLTGDLVYNFAGRGRWSGRDHTYGDSLNFALKGFYRISQSESKERTFSVFMGPHFEHTARERGTIKGSAYDSGALNDSSGGNVGYWQLGLYSVFSPAVVVNVSYAQAVYRDMNFSSDFDADPAESYKTNLSVTFLF